MPLSTATTPQAPDATQTGAPSRPSASSAIQIWLGALALMVLAMVIVGGATRLTHSGLSITEWKPIVGIIPPLSHADWQDAFAKYQQIPEYQQLNKGMSLAEFKGIFWWEWSHRFLGRMIGFAFLLPFLYFLIRRQIPRALMPRLLGLFVLGGLQGLLGWYMVMSGLVDRLDVSQYRLAAHLGAAALIYAAILWVLFGLRDRAPDQSAAAPPRGFVRSAALLVALIYLQILAGAFVAGLDAGLSHNTWPLMDGRWIPGGLGVMSPWYLNLFENVLTVQFDHRILAYIVALWAFAHTALLWRSRQAGRGPALVLSLAVLAQIGLGIWTLLAHVPIPLGVAHQAGAFIVFALALYHWHALIRLRSMPALPAARAVAS